MLVMVQSRGSCFTELALTYIALRTLGRLAALAARVVCTGKETPPVLVLCTVYQAGEASS